MKNTYLLLLFCSILFSCSDDDSKPTEIQQSTGSITVEYNNEKIIFENPELILFDTTQEYDLIAIGRIEFKNTDVDKYFVHLTFNKEDKNFVLHSVNFNTTEQVGTQTYHVINYSAFATGPIISDNFYNTTSLDSQNIFTGSFNGVLSSQNESSIEIPKAFFNLNLTDKN
jgi:hypothetical protein